MSDIKRLEKFNKIIQKIAKEFGLDFFETEFLIIPNEKMLEILAYRIPGNYGHWSFGRDYEIERTKYEYGMGLPYELVLNCNPAKAYLMENNPFVLQVLIMAHVYGHVDFMKNNANFKNTRKDIIDQAAASRERFDKYEADYGIEETEKTIEAAQSIELNLGFSLFKKEQEKIKEAKKIRQPKLKTSYSELFEDNRKSRKYDINESVEVVFSEDIIGFIAENSRKLKNWQKDILLTIREQMEYFFPNIETKIINEGWATFWHERIMHELFKRKYLDDKDHGVFNYYHSMVTAFNKLRLNPYLVGSSMFKDIEDRWNRGAFGEEYEKLSSKSKKMYDLKLNQGIEKIFEVRKIYNDAMFLREFLTKELIDDLNLYFYREFKNPNVGQTDYIIVERRWEKIRDILVRSKFLLFPTIVVRNEEHYRKRNWLFLEHIFDGIPLDNEFTEKTLRHIQYLWGDDVLLLTYEREKSDNDSKSLWFFKDEEKEKPKFKKVLWILKGGGIRKRYLTF